MPNSQLFFFVSSDKWIALSRLILVGAMIWLSFKGHISNLKMRRYIWLAGISFMSVGTALMTATQVNGLLFDYFKPLDLLLLIEAGIIFSLVSLETVAQTHPASKKLESATYSKSSAASLEVQ
jgi:hypothetical protein